MTVQFENRGVPRGLVEVRVLYKLYKHLTLQSRYKQDDVAEKFYFLPFVIYDSRDSTTTFPAIWLERRYLSLCIYFVCGTDDISLF